MQDSSTLIRMANQIATYFALYPHDEAVDGIGEHLRQFWDPRMLSAIKAHVGQGGNGLHALVPEAVRLLELDCTVFRQPFAEGTSSRR